MRVKISGENDCARAARGLLRQAGFAVTEFLPGEAVLQGPLAGYAITIEETAGTERIHLDSVDGPLEAVLLKHITQLSKLPDSTLVYPGHDYKGDTVSTIGEERATNPLLRPASKDLQRTIGMEGADLVAVFAETRRRKDKF